MSLSAWFRPFLPPAVFLLFIFSEKTCLAQKQNHQWRYGATGITFNTNPPSQVQGASLYTPEGSASVADRNTGELLFYTNGVTVWNAQDSVMQNGTGLRGGSQLSSTTAAVIVPKPGSNNLFYIFTVDEGASGSGSGGIRYNLVDMNLDNGLGGIVPGQKNIFLFQTNTEKLEVVPAANGSDIWIVTHENSNFVSFRLGPDGIQTTPVQSVVSGNLGNTAGHLKVNRQFNMLACGSLFEGKIRLFNFNNATGVVADGISFGLNPFLNNSPLIYGLEFSPGGRFLYASNLLSLVQYDVSLATPQAIESSAFLLNAAGTSASIQLAPDNKIYITNGSLDVITCPDKPGNLCGFETGTLAGGGYGLPKWVYYAGDSASSLGGNAILSRDSCLGASTQFSLRNNAGFSAVSWNFGDPASGASNSGSGAETSHVFSAPGTYNVRAILTTACGFDTILLNNFAILPCNLPCAGQISRSADSCLQNDFSFSISGPEIISVSWNFGDPGSGSANSSSLQAPVHRFSAEGQFLVRALVDFSCGKDTLEIPVMVKDCSLPVCSASIESQIIDSCLGEVAFSIASGNPVVLQSWDFGDSASGNLNSSSKNNPQHRFTGSGKFKVRLVALLACGLDTAEKEVTVQLCEKPVCEIRIPNAISPNGDDFNDVFLPQSNCAFLEYELSIYNRWGKLIYSGNRLADWPGSRNATDPDPGGDVYFYTLRWRFDGEAAQTRKGTLTLLR